MRNRRQVIFALAVLGALGAVAPNVGAASRPPNVVIIFADDLGYGDVGYQGAPDIPTPHIDRLAAGGVRFTDGYVTCAICSPSRVGLLTGRYQNRHGFEVNPGPIPPQREEAGMVTSEITLAQMLKEAGYATGMVGKWHLGMLKKFHPTRRGFDEFFGFLHGAHGFLDPMAARRLSDPIMRGLKTAEVTGYLTHVFTDEALAFIDRHADQPFFLYLPYNAVHTPLEATDEGLARVAGIADQDRRTYAAMTVAMDDGVGAVLARLEERGLEDNTIVFFLSDNGGVSKHARNAPLRGGKATYWEGGIRVPFCVRWPAGLPEGKVYREPVISLDIVPTVVAATGAKLPADRPIDGVDLLPFLTGATDSAPHETLYWRMFDRRAARRGNWKLVNMGAGDELYDLASDLSESRNLASEKPEVLRQLVTAFEKWSAQMADPAWTYPTREEMARFRRSRRRR
jgi:arylsulfatase A-like enzyme